MAASESLIGAPSPKPEDAKGKIDGAGNGRDKAIGTARDDAYGPKSQGLTKTPVEISGVPLPPSDPATTTSIPFLPAYNVPFGKAPLEIPAAGVAPAGNALLGLAPQAPAHNESAPIEAQPTTGVSGNNSGSESLVDHSSFSIADMAFREKYVLGGVKDTLDGVKKRYDEAVHDWPLTAVEVVSGIAIGSALVLASRNPALATPMRILNRTMLGIAAVDLVSRVGIPSYDALAHPSHLEADRKDVGDRLGSAVVDYSMAALAGGVGSRALTPLAERTSVGSMISGYDFFKTPAGAQVRVFKSGNALISKDGVRVFRPADWDFNNLDPLATDAPKNNIVGNNDLLRETFAKAEMNPQGWRQGKDIVESAGKFATWFETVTGALASELVERSVDVGIGLIEHNYLVKTLEGPHEPGSPGPDGDGRELAGKPATVPSRVEEPAKADNPIIATVPDDGPLSEKKKH